MEILDLRQVRAGDLEALLLEESRVWREQLYWDYSSSSDLIRRFVDSRSLPGYAAIESGRTVGYSFFVYEDYKGLIGNLFVSRPYCGATEKQLLAHVIETMQETPGVRRIEAQLMMFGAGLLEETFSREHFKAFTRQFMMLDLPAKLPAPHPDAGFAVVPWDERYFDEGAALITRAYSNHIDSEINDQYRSVSGAGRFLRNIIHYPGCGVFHTPGSFLAIDRETGTLCGMVLTSIVSERVGHVTQVCVSPEFHGRGIGYELMRKSVEAFEDAGFSGLSLTVTSANRKAVRLYEQMGFRTLREFSAFVWEAAGHFA
jgi:ribosomal protein S18 acetylase RimI-like enzyme